MVYKEKNQKEFEINERVVRSLAKRLLVSGFTLEEIETYGLEGLEIARQKFDPTSGYRFICYAIWYIRKNIELRISKAKF